MWKFAVIGDTHYIRSYEKKDLRIYNVQNYVRLNNVVIPRILKEIHDANPDFLIHTGDVIEGSNSKKSHVPEMIEALGKYVVPGVPTVYCVGNHDTHNSADENDEVRKLLRTANEAALGEALDRNYF
jgi:DNA repair exonuclease SbcCD nuclease subunit